MGTRMSATIPNRLIMPRYGPRTVIGQLPERSTIVGGPDINSVSFMDSTRHRAPKHRLPAAIVGVVVRPFGFLARHRQLLLQTSIADVRARVAASTLGWLWIALYPLLFLGTYAVVYVYVFRVRFPTMGGTDYVLFIFCGLIPFLWFSESVSLGTSSVVANPGLVKNTMYPIDLVPAKSVAASQATYLFGTSMLLAALAVTGRLTAWALLWPVMWVLQFVFLVGVAWLAAAACVFLRDLQQLVGVALLMLMMLSPIAYPPDAVPEGLRPFLAMNPLCSMISAYQDILLRGVFPSSLGVFAAIAVVTFVLGHVVFSRLKAVFADHV